MPCPGCLGQQWTGKQGGNILAGKQLLRASEGLHHLWFRQTLKPQRHTGICLHECIARLLISFGTESQYA